MTAPAPAPFQIAILGDRGPQFAQAVQQALGKLLPSSQALNWCCCDSAADSAAASLRWLLAWEDEPGVDAQSAMADLQAHQRLRQGLLAQGMDHLVLRGSLQERVEKALASLVPWLPGLAAQLPQTGVRSRRPGTWACDSCSDPDCEHRSFTALLAERSAR